MKKAAGFLFGLFLALCFSMTGYSSGDDSGKIIIFHAGSLSVPFEKMEADFEKAHPGIDLEREAAGSQACARKITDLKKPCDIMASADYRVIDKFLIPEYADWNVHFATNQMVLAYTGRSKFAAEISESNWFDILTRPGVVWGHSDPNLDPCGYRALLVLKLAQLYYKKPGLYQRLIDNRPVGNIRPKSVELVALLQTGNMDYAWEYRSVAVQHDLRYIELPAEINLGDPRQDDFYRRAVVEVTGKKPGEMIEMRGQSITYGITRLKNAPHPAPADLFLSYLLSSGGGLQILKEMGQMPLTPPEVPTKEMFDRLPKELKPLVELKAE
jgi:molybdate/tungstate transport system substrate-binding protein